MPLGVDLYEKYDTVTNWTVLARSIAFAWIKVTNGIHQASVLPDAYINNATNHEIPWGPYHYALNEHPVTQAETLLREMDRLHWTTDDRHLIPMLDLEDRSIPGSIQVGLTRVFLETVYNETGGKVALYADASRLRLIKPASWGYNWLVIWVAAWGPNDGLQHPIVGYDGPYDIHQYTSKGQLPGVSTWTDLDWTDDLPALLANGNTMAPEDVWKVPLPHRKRPGDSDTRDTVPAGEQLEFTNKAAWLAADATARIEAQLAHMSGTLPAAQSALVAAVQATHDGTGSVDQVAAALAAALPGSHTPDQVAHAVYDAMGGTGTN